MAVFFRGSRPNVHQGEGHYRKIGKALKSSHYCLETCYNATQKLSMTKICKNVKIEFWKVQILPINPLPFCGLEYSLHSLFAMKIGSFALFLRICGKKSFSMQRLLLSIFVKAALPVILGRCQRASLCCWLFSPYFAPIARQLISCRQKSSVQYKCAGKKGF